MTSADGSAAVWMLGRLPFVGEALLGQLLTEARERQPAGEERTHAPAGDMLSRLAVSRQLREAVSLASGLDLVPTYDAVYQYQPPGSDVPPHRDAAGYDLVFHLTLEHEGSPGSVLEVQHPDRAERYALPRGEGLLLRGRDVVHRWTPLAADERRILVAVGFRPAA